MEKTSSERAAEIRRAYQREWRAKNKDKVREYNRRFWEKRAEQTEASNISTNGNERTENRPTAGTVERRNGN